MTEILLLLLLAQPMAVTDSAAKSAENAAATADTASVPGSGEAARAATIGVDAGTPAVANSPPPKSPETKRVATVTEDGSEFDIPESKIPKAADGTPMKSRDGKLNPSFFNPPRSYRSPEGYQKARWGMTTAEVRQLFPKARTVNGNLGFDGEVAGRKAVTLFLFTDNRLASTVVLFTATHTTAARHLDDYEKLKDLLTVKYGMPGNDSVDWRDGSLFRDSPEHFSAAVTLGHAVPQATWDTNESMIRISCEGKGARIQTTILYASKRLGKALVDARDRAASDDL